LVRLPDYVEARLTLIGSHPLSETSVEQLRRWVAPFADESRDGLTCGVAAAMRRQRGAGAKLRRRRMQLNFGVSDCLESKAC
jgi:hypothetical protein